MSGDGYWAPRQAPRWVFPAAVLVPLASGVSAGVADQSVPIGLAVAFVVNIVVFLVAMTVMGAQAVRQARRERAR